MKLILNRFSHFKRNLIRFYNSIDSRNLQQQHVNYMCVVFEPDKKKKNCQHNQNFFMLVGSLPFFTQKKKLMNISLKFYF